MDEEGREKFRPVFCVYGMMMELENIIEKIREADLVLVGLGEELDVMNDVAKGQCYQELIRRANVAWRFPFILRSLLEQAGELKEKSTDFYNRLAECLQQKNYFVVSLCKDGLIGDSSLEKERIVEPCGGYRKLQCSERCSSELYEVSDELDRKIRAFTGGNEGESEWWEPLCPHCGKALVFNNTDAANYVEEGYLRQWQVYRKWLQGTVNKKVCVLELGVGMKYPTVIRWPFEKIVFFNQKAELFRIHDRLSQIPEEIRDRGHGICRKPEEFLRELSEKF